MTDSERSMTSTTSGSSSAISSAPFSRRSNSCRRTCACRRPLSFSTSSMAFLSWLRSAFISRFASRCCRSIRNHTRPVSGIAEPNITAAVITAAGSPENISSAR